MKPILRSCGPLTTLLAGLGLAFALTGPCTARTWYVVPDSTGLATPIKAALDSASSGDTVLVAPGTYLRTDDPETWTRPGPGVALVSEHGPEVTVIEFCNITTGIGLSDCEGARVSGFTIRFAEKPGCGHPGGTLSGISCYHCTDVVVEDCIVEDVTYGIKVRGESGSWWKPLFRNITIRDCNTGITCGYVSEPGRPHFLGISITDCRVGAEVVDSEPQFESCAITYCSTIAISYVGHCGGGCDKCIIAHNQEGVWIYSDPPLAAPGFNGSWLPENANDFFDNAGWDIWYAYSTPDALVMAIYNYWGTECPDFTSRLHGRVLYSPWMDSTHTVVLNEDHCPQAVEPSTWGSIKAMFR
jgi:hypothetical protein